MSESPFAYSFSERLFAAAFRVWCKTPRWLALRSWYLAFYGRVGYWLDDHAHGRMAQAYRDLKAFHGGYTLCPYLVSIGPDTYVGCSLHGGHAGRCQA